MLDDTRIIRLKNRYGDKVELIELDSKTGEWLLVVQNSQPIRIGYDKQNIAFVDPSGGPYIAKGTVYYVKGLVFGVDSIMSKGEDIVVYLSERLSPEYENFEEYVREYLERYNIDDNAAMYLTRFAENPIDPSPMPWHQEALGKQLHCAFKAGTPVAALGGDVYEEKCEGF